MDEIDENKCCYGCLCTGEDFPIDQFSFQYEPLKSIFQVDAILLCILCSRIIQRSELFIQNVQSNQILLQNFQNDLSSIQSIRNQVQPCISLTLTSLPSVFLSGTGNDESCSVTMTTPEVKVKMEMKEELDLEEEFIDGNDEFQDSFQDIKEEDCPLNGLLKEELDLESVDLKTLSKTIKKVKNKEGILKIKSTSRKKAILFPDPPNYITIQITEKQCMKERKDRLQSNSYRDCTYHCVDCIKGFMRKETYDKHMVKHSLKSGNFCCTICKQRFISLRKLYYHRKSHLQRYKCPTCELTLVGHNGIKQHILDKHIGFGNVFKCTQCPKVFSNIIKLRKHQSYTHSGKDRVICNACEKSYANKDTLLAHILRKHRSAGDAGGAAPRHACGECGAAFGSGAQLRAHATKHSDHRPYYCVECDRSFKTSSVLQQHLKTAIPHVKYLELPLPCGHCEKRFSIRRDLDRHVNRVHLNIKPYTCDKCDRAYINRWSLKDHKRYAHEGAKRPLRYPCAMCDRVFDRSSILKAHVRTHTGERPYHCAQCPAQFSQRSALGTHVKLVHLKLTRDGRPKASLK